MSAQFRALRRDRFLAPLAALALALSLGGCAASVNYTAADGPRYAHTAPMDTAGGTTLEQLRVVTFNIAYSKHVDAAIALLDSEPWLRRADVLLLQEMDEPGVRRIADALGAGYVYYPATQHFRTHRDFGNAIVTRLPIESDRKVILPHIARMGGSQRIAVGATLRVGDQRVRVYSVHLATLIGNGPGSRRQQLSALLADADSFPVTIIGGDFNSETVPELALARGYAWPTRTLPRTNGLWTFDHVLVKGIPSAAQAQAGTVESSRGASDHLPVWALLDLPTAVSRGSR